MAHPGEYVPALRNHSDRSPPPAGGGTDLDASRTYDLSSALAGYSPHPQEGYHVKVTVNAPSSIGADNKHKVFWVTDCDIPS